MTRRVDVSVWLLPALAAVLFLTALAGIRVARAGDLSALIGFGCHSPAPCFARLNQASLPPRALAYAGGGYDGQFFYYLAAEAAGGPRAVVDSDAFRRARMGLAWLVAPAYWIGPRALTLAFPLTLALVHALSTGLLALRLHGAGGETRATRLALYAYALNPFTALALLFSVADGLALALALVGLLALERGGFFLRAGAAPERESHEPTAPPAATPLARAACLACGVAVLAYAALTKESAVAAILAAAALPPILAAASPIAPRRIVRAMLYGAALAALMLAPTLLVWLQAGFSPALAAERGGVWFSGWLAYLRDADAFFSGRTMLAALLPALVALAPWCAWQALARLRETNPRGPSDSGAAWMALAAAGAGGALALGASATADEYWSTYPNIQRLFSLSALALAALGVAQSAPGARAKQAGARLAVLVLAGLFFFGSLMLLKTELTGTMPLLFFFEDGP